MKKEWKKCRRRAARFLKTVYSECSNNEIYYQQKFNSRRKAKFSLVITHIVHDFFFQEASNQENQKAF